MSEFRLCGVSGCKEKHHSKGYCMKHYTRLRRHGDPLISAHETNTPKMERISQSVEIITETGCWIWTGRTTQAGYGVLSVNAKETLAHRLAYKEYKGEIPKELFVCHACDVPSCVNPNHLFIGTQADNMRDMQQKGRGVKGESVGTSKLKERDAIEILNSTERYKFLAKKYKISFSAISNIRNGLTWKHVTKKELEAA